MPTDGSTERESGGRAEPASPGAAPTTVVDVPPTGLTLILRGVSTMATGGLPVLPPAVPRYALPGLVPGGPEAPATATPAPTAPAAAATNASGMPWRSGVFGHSLERTRRFEQVTGRPVDVIGVAPSRGSWETIMDPWWLERTPPGFTGVLDVAVPLWQEDGGLEAAASGGDVARWEHLGRTIEERYPGSTVRIGWEFNLGGWDHHATPENVESWKHAFRHASTALKRGGPSLLVTWNPNKGRGDSLPDASAAWPGDDVVDLVGLDAYDWWPAYSDSTWPQHRDGDQGWQYWVDFARAHGKGFTVPEWGVAPGNDHGGGDNPYYIEVVMDFLADNRDVVHSVIYFDEPNSYIANSIGDGQVPRAGAAYREAMSRLATTPTFPTGSPTASSSVTPATTEAAPSLPPSQGSLQGGPEPTPTAVTTDPSGRGPIRDADAWRAPDGATHGPVPG